jgi:hypothetical protein
MNAMPAAADAIALLMCDVDNGLLYGVWAAQERVRVVWRPRLLHTRYALQRETG